MPPTVKPAAAGWRGNRGRPVNPMSKGPRLPSFAMSELLDRKQGCVDKAACEAVADSSGRSTAGRGGKSTTRVRAESRENKTRPLPGGKCSWAVNPPQVAAGRSPGNGATAGAQCWSCCRQTGHAARLQSRHLGEGRPRKLHLCHHGHFVPEPSG